MKMRKKNMLILTIIGVLLLTVITYIVMMNYINKKEKLQDMNEQITDVLDEPENEMGTSDITLNTEEEILKVFNDNYELFKELAASLENGEGRFYCYFNTEEFVYRIDLDEIDINDLDVKDQVLFLINDLGFDSILEREEEINFYILDGYDERGITYAKPGTTIEEFDGGKVGKCYLIKDNWYYYWYHREEDCS